MDVINMPEDDEKDKCVICLDIKDDLRMLPCWHIACLTCIRKMEKIGEGKAVSCHICRRPFFAANIDSLPKPLECVQCSSYVRNPRKFPCCTRLYCSECMGSDSDGRAACFCSTNLYVIDDLPKPSICCACISLNTDVPAKCGHYLCRPCQLENKCHLCVAISTPPRFNPFGPGREQEQARLVWQMMANPQQYTEDRQQELTRYFQENIKLDISKGVIFLAVLLVACCYWGLGYKLWVAGFISLLLLRPNLYAVVALCLIVNFILSTATFYYFRYAFALIVSGNLAQGFIRWFALNAQPGYYGMFAMYIFIELATLAWKFLYFPAIFLHQTAMSIVVQILLQRLLLSSFSALMQPIQSATRTLV